MYVWRSFEGGLRDGKFSAGTGMAQSISLIKGRRSRMVRHKAGANGAL
jgi:hypothetical protein